MTTTTRRGGALVIALAILTLGAALLTGSSAAGRRTTRSVASFNAGMLAESESMRILAETIASISPGDSMAVGSDRQWNIGPREVGNGATATTAVRLHRISLRRLAIAVDCRIGPEDAVVARRRRLALLDHPITLDSLSDFAAPTLIPQWSIADIY